MTKIEDMTVDELEDRLADYEQWGWKTHSEAAKARLNKLERTDKEELDVPEELGGEPPDGWEAAHLRCSSVGFKE